MSIFKNNRCEVCNKDSVKKRCDYCKGRFDSQGQPFIVYCDIYKFKKGRKTLFLWVMDGLIVKIDRWYWLLVGKEEQEGFQLLFDHGFELEYKSEKAL